MRAQWKQNNGFVTVDASFLGPCESCGLDLSFLSSSVPRAFFPYSVPLDPDTSARENRKDAHCLLAESQ